MKLIHGTRMVQTNKDKKEHTWTLFNNNIGKELVIISKPRIWLLKCKKTKICGVETKTFTANWSVGDF